MHLLVIGAGYVGLVTAACFAESGHTVYCLDIDEEKVEQLKKGILPIFEPGLEELILRNFSQQRLSFSSDYFSALKNAEICFLALPTPSNEKGECDTRYVLEAASKIATLMSRDLILVIKSTVPVGTNKKVKERMLAILRERNLSLRVQVISNPEFLKEGSALSDFMKPDRIILGGNFEEVAQGLEALKGLYSPFSFSCDRILIMDPLSAELTKYAANAMLASRISFMNEIAGLCEHLQADIHSVRLGIGSDQRIGYQFLYAGAGYGGSCFPKDIAALQATAQSLGYATPLIDAIQCINLRQKKVLAEKITRYFRSRGGIEKKSIAILGLSFKPNTDDMREAPSIELISELLIQGAQLRLFDPIAMHNAKKIFGPHPSIYWCQDEYEAADGAHALALVTEWKQFRSMDSRKMLSKMCGRGFFDGRNQFKAHEMRARGFDYFGIGIPHVDSTS